MPEDEVVNVLCVDDVEQNLVALETLLSRPGLRLVRARSGTEALELLLSQDIALALVDVQMPGMDGFELAELMRGSQRTRHVPIIFLTAANPNRKRLFQGYGAGAVDFLFKPIDPELLLAKVEVFAQLQRQKEQLARQLEQIQLSQRMSDLFIGVLGHDLRNPLSSISTAAALLELNPGDADATRKKARMMLGASRRMERLIQQVLDFALARVRGAIPIQPSATDLAKIARQVVAENDTPTTRRVEFEVTGDCAGSWDTDRLMQAVSNLVGNALEHGDAEAPIALRIDGTACDWVVLEVENRGEIPANTAAILFSPFKPRERGARGLGLGLYIVDQIARSHGGSVELVPLEHRTRLRLALPRQPEVPD